MYLKYWCSCTVCNEAREVWRFKISFNKCSAFIYPSIISVALEYLIDLQHQQIQMRRAQWLAWGLSLWTEYWYYTSCDSIKANKSRSNLKGYMFGNGFLRHALYCLIHSIGLLCFLGGFFCLWFFDLWIRCDCECVFYYGYELHFFYFNSDQDKTLIHVSCAHSKVLKLCNYQSPDSVFATLGYWETPGNWALCWDIVMPWQNFSGLRPIG